MTSFSSAAGTGAAAGSTSAAASSTIKVGRIDVLLSTASHLQDGHAIAPDDRAEQQHGGDDDGHDQRSERARDPGVSVLDLGQDRRRAEVEARKDQEDH